MTIDQIKAQTGQMCLDFQRQLNEQGVPQPWISHWDNINRVRVTMHDEVNAIIANNRDFSGLGLKVAKVQPKEPGKEPYTRYVIITPKQHVASY